MSTIPESEFDLDKLFLPAWAQEPASAKLYAKFEGGGDDRNERRGDKGARPPRRDFGRPSSKDRGPRPRENGPRKPRRDDDRRPQHTDHRREQRSERPQAPLAPLPEINVTFAPDEKGVDSLSRQIKMTGRAYPLFEIAQMILQKPERHTVTFATKKKPDGKPAQPLFVCALDDTLWLSEDETVAYVLKKHFGTFYQAERTPTEPPKGTYTFVAQCGMSGVIFGPPNYHDYQNRMRKLHAERFSRIPFETYKARVKIVRDEAIVKQWIEEQSSKVEYVCLNLPEPLRLPSMEEVEKHFRQAHKDNIIKQVESFTLTGAATRLLRSPELTRLSRQAWEDQRHFPLQIATVLSQQFATRGLQFFKVNRTVTHVSVARPHFLDLDATPVSEGIRQIVQFINSHPKCTRRQLMEALAPTLASATPSATSSTEPAEPTSEQTAVISDLHWLIHQGHVIEFASGILDTAKRPLPKPPQPKAKPAAETAPQPSAETPQAAPADPPANGEAPQPVATESPTVAAPEATAVSSAVTETPPAEPMPVTATTSEPASEASPAPVESH